MCGSPGPSTGDGWLVAEHYCYLGDADGDQLTRVVTETVFGSLLGRLAEAEPVLVHEQRPRFAADAQALTTAVDTALRTAPCPPPQTRPKAWDFPASH
ncbi:hypothetical protein [Streptomyces sp. NRRL S-474]|uniref:hypothetical protein n=1 Tax=Streptomyces sp. NRRL S-474 TaxID=1463909 RepID=UPI00131EABB9|nr:hypothetical protein [Streptomyces sp. NRRL S-474]